MSKKYPDTDPKWPQCMCCKDTGIVGGGDIEFKHCLCQAGRDMARQGRCIDELQKANETRAKLGIK